MHACGCAEPTSLPVRIRFSENVPDAHRALFMGSAERWNEVADIEALTQGDAECEVVVESGGAEDWEADTYGRGECGMRIRYGEHMADRCVFLHELGHVLGLGHYGGSIMSKHGCDGELQDLTSADGDRLRARWGL